MVHETDNTTIATAVEWELAGERLDRRDGLALIAQPVETLPPLNLTDPTASSAARWNTSRVRAVEDAG